MSIIKGWTGEVRLAWRLLIVILLYVAVAVLLRFIPVSLCTAFLVSGGVVMGDALASARAIFFKDPVWSIVISILNGLMSLPLVWILIRAIGRRRLVWKTVGLGGVGLAAQQLFGTDIWRTAGSAVIRCRWSEFLYLVGMFHAMMNTLLSTLYLKNTEIGGLLWFSIAGCL